MCYKVMTNSQTGNRVVVCHTDNNNDDDDDDDDDDDADQLNIPNGIRHANT